MINERKLFALGINPRTLEIFLSNAPSDRWNVSFAYFDDGDIHIKLTSYISIRRGVNIGKIKQMLDVLDFGKIIEVDMQYDNKEPEAWKI